MIKAMRTGLVTLVLAAFLAPLSMDSTAAQKDTGKDGKASQFEVYKDKGGKYRFRFYDSAGDEVAMAIKGYDEKSDCMKAIEAIKKDAAKAKVIEEKK